MILFGVGFRLLLVVLALAIERVGTLLRVGPIVDTLRAMWPHDFAADIERVRDAFRSRSGPS